MSEPPGARLLLLVAMTENSHTSPTEVRAIFNNYVLPRVESGEVAELVQSSGTASPSSGQPPGTRSERIVYLDGGERIAVAHRFVLPDGSIGGSGRPDPKAVRFGSEWLIAGPN